MDFEKKELSSYLDGIPFTIGPKFCPPRPVAIPFCINYQLPMQLMSEEYDFSLESRTIALHKSKCEEMEKARASEAIEREQSTNPVGQGASLWNPDTILLPRSQIPGKISNETLTSEPCKKINLSDFENDTTSPFDYMELQTINDLEELNTVFQGLCPTTTATITTTSETAVGETSAPSNQDVINEELLDLQNPGNVSKSISFPLPQSLEAIHSNSDSDSNQKTLEEDLTSWACSVSKSFSKTSDNYLSYSYPSMSSGTESDDYSSSASEKVKRNSLFNTAHPPPLSNLDHGSATGEHSRHPENNLYSGHPVLGSPLRGSKSIPDLSTLAPENSIRNHSIRSHTPPVSVFPEASTYSLAEKAAVLRRLNRSNNINNDDFVSNNGIVDIDSFEVEQNPRSPPDPYDKLSDSAKRIIDTIAEMGFQRGQVSRTVQHVGLDEKKVVEHLCQIQALEESGYDILEAEAALQLHDYDKKEAIHYLDLLNQFQDFGFGKDVIKKALVQNKNDRDKAIEALLS